MGCTRFVFTTKTACVSTREFHLTGVPPWADTRRLPPFAPTSGPAHVSPRALIFWRHDVSGFLYSYLGEPVVSSGQPQGDAWASHYLYVTRPHPFNPFAVHAHLLYCPQKPFFRHLHHTLSDPVSGSGRDQWPAILWRCGSTHPPFGVVTTGHPRTTRPRIFKPGPAQLP